MLLKNKVLAVSTTVFSLIAPAAFAAPTTLEGRAGPDFSEIVGAIDFSTVITGIMTAAVAIVSVIIAVKGAKMLMSFLRGA